MRKAFTLGALAAVLAGCSATPSESSQPYSDATPDVAGLALETTGGVLDGLGDLSSASAPSPCQPYQYLCLLQQDVRELNRFVRATVGPVEALAETAPASSSSEEQVYGPVDAPPDSPVATFRLTVRTGADAATFRFKLEGKPTGAGDAKYATVLAGRLTKGLVAHRGTGVFAIDLTALAALNVGGLAANGFQGAGQILASFVNAAQTKSLTYSVSGFVPDTTVASVVPLTAAFVGHKTAAGETRVRMVSLGAYLPPKSGSASGPELALSRGRWLPGTGGRAAVVFADEPPGVDVASYDVNFFLGVSCWDASLSEGYHGLFGCKGILPCPAAPAALTQGWPSTSLADAAVACIPGTELADETDPPATDPSSTTPEPGAPATPGPLPGSLAELDF
ncbi:MAG TPA: hypothetical protein VLV17_00625 [Anaeromyxobacteraceae bacterium]|nr:hypothetical protein [Anaeromyxobacteraceae bacterium]